MFPHLKDLGPPTLSGTSSSPLGPRMWFGGPSPVLNIIMHVRDMCFQEHRTHMEVLCHRKPERPGACVASPWLVTHQAPREVLGTHRIFSIVVSVSECD